MRRFVCFILSCTIVLSLFLPCISVADAQTISSSEVQLCNNLTAKLNETRDLNLIISDITYIYDFANNTYYLIEYAPVGYAIMHDLTGEFVEFSSSAPSPYRNYHFYPLYYCGPTFYYYFDGTNYTHVWYDEVLTDSSLSSAESISKTMYHNLLSTEDENLVDINATTAVTRHLLDDDAVINNLLSDQSTGYMSGNCCGFIASGLLLLWHRYYDESPELIDAFSYLHYSQKAYLNSNFTRKLLSYGSGNLSTADGVLGYSSIMTVLEDYGNSINAEISSTVAYFPSTSSIISHLKTSKQPIILFGELYDTVHPSNLAPLGDKFFHAVLAYGYTSDNTVIVHLGWGGGAQTEIATTDSLYQSLYIDSYIINQMSFSDLPQNSWAYDSVAYCTRYSIIDEQSGSSFAPTLPMERGTFVNALYAIAGSPEVSANDIDNLCNIFSDINSDHEYIDALAWAYYNAILTGMTTTTIEPSGTITRAQAVTFLYRFNNAIGTYQYSITTGPSADSFDDYELCGYSSTAMNWATRRHIIQGIGDNLIDPLSTMTRAQCAQMIYNFSLKADNYGEDE